MRSARACGLSVVSPVVSTTKFDRAAGVRHRQRDVVHGVYVEVVSAVGHFRGEHRTHGDRRSDEYVAIGNLNRERVVQGVVEQVVQLSRREGPDGTGDGPAGGLDRI